MSLSKGSHANPNSFPLDWDSKRQEAVHDVTCQKMPSDKACHESLEDVWFMLPWEKLLKACPGCLASRTGSWAPLDTVVTDLKVFRGDWQEAE